MVIFDTSKEAMAFAVKRRNGFRELIRKAPRDPIYKNAPRMLKSRVSFLKKAIGSVRVRKIQPMYKGGKPLYEVTGM